MKGTMSDTTAESLKQVASTITDTWRQWIPELVNMLKDTKDFVLEQSPIVLKEILKIGMLDSGRSTFVSLCWAILFGVITTIFHKRVTSSIKNLEDKIEEDKITIGKPKNGAEYHRAVQNLRCREEALSWQKFVKISNWVIGLLLVSYNFSNFIKYSCLIIKIYIAPRIYLIEYLTHMVNK